MTPTPESVRLLLGPLYLGTILSTCLFGVSAPQFTTYFASAPRLQDSLTVRSLVVWEFFLSIFCTATSVYVVWLYLVDNCFNPAFLASGSWPIAAVPLLSALSACPVQIFMAFRVLRLSKSRFIFGLLVLLTISNGCIAFATSMLAFGLTFDEGFRLTPVADSWLAITVANDLALTYGPCQIVRLVEQTNELQPVLELLSPQQSNGFQQFAASFQFFHGSQTLVETDTVITRLIRSALESAAFATFFSIMVLVMFTVFPTTGFQIMFAQPMGRIYTSTLLSTLNGRESLRHALRGTYEFDESVNIDDSNFRVVNGTGDPVAGYLDALSLATPPLPTARASPARAARRTHQSLINPVRGAHSPFPCAGPRVRTPPRRAHKHLCVPANPDFICISVAGCFFAGVFTLSAITKSDVTMLEMLKIKETYDGPQLLSLNVFGTGEMVIEMFEVSPASELSIVLELPSLHSTWVPTHRTGGLNRISLLKLRHLRVHVVSRLDTANYTYPVPPSLTACGSRGTSRRACPNCSRRSRYPYPGSSVYMPGPAGASPPFVFLLVGPSAPSIAIQQPILHRIEIPFTRATQPNVQPFLDAGLELVTTYIPLMVSPWDGLADERLQWGRLFEKPMIWREGQYMHDLP
ncbi:hypothetical protein C8R45DRAFT_1110936 [Mycena sanguinolenta]|nr:hypothetical protein C8R45DRAFT_1110936 [Mycena sanguinolenta]